MDMLRASLMPAVLVTAALLLSADRTAAQEVALTPLESKEVAKGYRAEALKLKMVINDKGEKIGRISDFVFGKDDNIYVVLGVGDYTGLTGQFIAIPFHALKLDDRSDIIVLPGASRAALEKLPVFVSDR
jgi:sporulation protein YlmC with PRC-barrel domain